MEQKIPTKLFPKDLVVLSELQPIDVMIRDIENHKTTDETSKKEADKKVISPGCLATQGSSSDEFSLFGKFLTFFNAKIVS